VTLSKLVRVSASLIIAMLMIPVLLIINGNLNFGTASPDTVLHWFFFPFIATIFVTAKAFRQDGGMTATIDRFRVTTWVVSLLILTAVHFEYIFRAAGFGLNVTRISAALVGVAFLTIGNLLPKLRRNYSIGLITPWTCSNEQVWDKAHRFLAPLMVFVGLVVLALDVSRLPDAALLSVTVSIALVPAGLSIMYAVRASHQTG